ncbi:phage tail domain-containing protein [Halobacillus naozhouensis]|uniref:Phage tail family protein n=1 Tax=Halobacillus naozhouensis TaxID=554880 RepID=A0ABY8J168_9BACI|nr:phage tail domain-containing protein [Halobacillus naozhouensis]WFT76248.1 phage tail family protein [Halobacillus naozhouensis]
MGGVIIPTITFTNARGERVTFTSGAYPYLLQSYEGVGELDADIQSQRAPYQDGSTYIDTLLQNRPLTLRVMIDANNPNTLASMKRHISKVFNPKLGEGLLSFERYGEVYEIQPVADGTPVFLSGPQNSAPTFQKIMINLIAHDPYWKDPQEVSRALKAYEGLFEFPFNFPIELGQEGDSTILENEGSVETPVQINIQGPVKNPRITNRTTGEYLQLNRTLSSDEILHIDTNEQNKRVEIYREGRVIEKAWGYLDDYSDFLMLLVGSNEIAYTADSGTTGAIEAIAWKNRYAGI